MSPGEPREQTMAGLNLVLGNLAQAVHFKASDSPTQIVVKGLFEEKAACFDGGGEPIGGRRERRFQLGPTRGRMQGGVRWRLGACAPQFMAKLHPVRWQWPIRGGCPLLRKFFPQKMSRQSLKTANLGAGFLAAWLAVRMRRVGEARQNIGHGRRPKRTKRGKLRKMTGMRWGWATERERIQRHNSPS